ncbi:unnamed protein product [Meloidogyne enterolobii]|uniref:Uncharacterized protein n=1 Tax=Meloidogyne enterolobii TaxID=390850 RepID=A0ACB0Z2J8_MELEN
MKFSIYNFNGSKKKKAVCFNIVALSIAVLVLVGQVNSAGAKNVGLGNHILKKGKVNLAAGSDVVANNKDIEQYKAKFPDACDVDFDSEGNIVLHYKSQGATKDKGCTVDLLTNIRNKILFTAGLIVTKDIGTCLTWNFNENTLPFAYSLLNEEIRQFHNGPIFSKDGGCCAGTCMKRTGLEVSWWLYEDRQRFDIVLNANPIGMGLINQTGQAKSTVEKKKEYPTVEISDQPPRYQINFPGTPIATTRGSCIENILLSPITWEIDGKSPDPKMNRLLVFHLLPQRASRIREWIGNEYKIKGNPPQGPKCDDLTIKFVSDNQINYSLLIYFNKFSRRATTNCLMFFLLLI